MRLTEVKRHAVRQIVCDLTEGRARGSVTGSRLDELVPASGQTMPLIRQPYSKLSEGRVLQ